MTRGALLIAVLTASAHVAHGQTPRAGDRYDPYTDEGGIHDRRRHEDDWRDRQRYDDKTRHEGAYGYHRPGTWFQVAGVTDTRRPRTLLWVGNQPLQQLAIQAVDGAVFIRRVSVELTNHDVVDYPVNARMLAGQSHVIQLRGRPVYRMEVVTDPQVRGHYQIRGVAAWSRTGPVANVPRG